jgi:hypothetical protein
MKTTYLIRNISFILLGVVGLILKGRYTGPYYELVHSYAGNVTASFAVYFNVSIGAREFRFNRLIVAVIALLVVELFEATNGFGVMSNTYDPFDFLANAVGVAAAIGVDVVSARMIESRGSPSGSVDPESPNHTKSR